MSGNGPDVGQVLAMLRDVLSVQNDTRSEVRAQGRKLDDLANQVADLRQALTQYHASVLGHGILITELDTRLRRVEQHLNLSPSA